MSNLVLVLDCSSKNCTEWTLKHFRPEVNETLSISETKRLVGEEPLALMAVRDDIGIIIDSNAKHYSKTSIKIGLTEGRKCRFYGKALFVGMSNLGYVGLTLDQINFIKSTTTVLATEVIS